MRILSWLCSEIRCIEVMTILDSTFLHETCLVSPSFQAVRKGGRRHRFDDLHAKAAARLLH